MYRNAKEEIIARLPIEDVIGRYVQLKKSGRSLKGKSPFTNERTPSFFVSPDKQVWHDFSSGRGGDMFTFIMLVENVDFKEALEQLAEQAGVDLAKYRSPAGRAHAAKRDQLLQINQLATNYYQHQLVKNPDALKYVKSRQLSQKTIMNWGIGFAPMNPNLFAALQKKKFGGADFRDAGLANSRGGELFRNRLMIPLRDRTGKVIGFTGRIIGDGQPKYLNTPDVELFHKGQHLFGLNFAKSAIGKIGYAVVVEGHLDVISAHQAGTTNVVGVAGTALTRDHLVELARFCGEVRFCFDGDRAGINATERAIKLAPDLDINITVIDMGKFPAKDPDELIKKDPVLWQQAISQAQPAVNWLRDKYIDSLGISTARNKATVADKTIAVISNLSDPVAREGYLRELSDKLSISFDALNEKLKNFMADGATQKSNRPLRPIKVDKVSVDSIAKLDKFRYADSILAYLIAKPSLRGKYLPLLNDAELDEANRVIKQLIKAPTIGFQQLVNQTEAMLIKEGIIKLDEDTSLTDRVKQRAAELELIHDNPRSIGGVKSDGDLLDYFCNQEYYYHSDLVEKLLVQLGQTKLDDQKKQLMERLAVLNQTVNLLDPSRNRRQQYRGLQQYWQDFIKTLDK